MRKIAVMVLITFLNACSMLDSPPISGTYKGTLPCADCEKIEAVLILNPDNSYEYHTIYFKHNKPIPFSEKGTFSVLSKNPNIIRLEVLNGLPEITLQVDGSVAKFRDDNGKTVKEQSYQLVKIK